MIRDLIRMKPSEVTVLYDLGGGTFDLTVIREAQGRIDVIANEGNIALGGEDTDTAFCDYLINRNSVKYPELRTIADDRQQKLLFLQLCAKSKVVYSSPML